MDNNNLWYSVWNFLILFVGPPKRFRCTWQFLSTTRGICTIVPHLYILYGAFSIAIATAVWSVLCVNKHDYCYSIFSCFWLKLIFAFCFQLSQLLNPTVSWAFLLGFLNVEVANVWPPFVFVCVALAQHHRSLTCSLCAACLPVFLQWIPFAVYAPSAFIFHTLAFRWNLYVNITMPAKSVKCAMINPLCSIQMISNLEFLVHQIPNQHCYYRALRMGNWITLSLLSLLVIRNVTWWPPMYVWG